MTVAANVGKPARTDSIFFPSMAAALALTVFLGFSRSFYLRPVYHGGPHELSTLMIVHGIAFTSWIAVFIAQTGLVAANRRDVHRKLGIAGACIAASMVVLGTWLAIDALRRGEAPNGAPSPQFFFAIPIFTIIVFGILTWAAIANRARPAWHKRLMLLGTVAILSAAIARWPLAIFETGGPPAFFAGTDVFVAVVVLYDVFTLKRVHPATLWGAGAVIASEIVAMAVGGTAAWGALAAWLTA